MITHMITVIPRPRDFDRLAHVNHAVILEYLEAGRTAWLAHTNAELATTVAAVVARLEIDYRHEVHANTLTVSTELIERGFYRITFMQQVMAENSRGSHEILVEARVQVALIDIATRQLQPLEAGLSYEIF